MAGPKRSFLNRGRTPQDAKTNLQMLQLVICLVILGAVLLVRMTRPEEVRRFLERNINQGIDAQEAITYIGETFKSVFKMAPGPLPAESGSPEPSPEVSAPPEVSSTPESPPENASPTPELGVGGFAEPILYLEEGFLPSYDDDEVDDTLPLPFGMEKPEKADYTVYSLPFQTQLPVNGVQSSGFGYREHPTEGETRFHYGVDIAAPKGTVIQPFAEGTVALTGNSASYGLYAMIKHEGGFVTLYAHCSKISVKAGQKVTMKDEIAQVGSTGVATGAHLHLEIRLGNSLLNPSYYLEIPLP